MAYTTTMRNVVLVSVLAICTAASLTSEDIQKILDDTSRGVAVSNLGEEFDAELRLDNFRDKLRTLGSLESENEDLYPEQEPDVLGDAMNVGGMSANFGTRLNDDLHRFQNIDLEYRLSQEPIQSGWSEDTVFKRENYFMNAFDMPNHRNDQDSYKHLIKRNLFCNRRRGCGRKRGKRERQVTTQLTNEVCDRLKCETKRVLCNRGGCRSKRGEWLISKTYCADHICSSKTSIQTNKVLDYLGATNIENPDEKLPNRKGNQENIPKRQNFSSVDYIANSKNTKFIEIPTLQQFLVNLIKKYFSRQKNRELIERLRKTLCEKYIFCELKNLRGTLPKE